MFYRPIPQITVAPSTSDPHPVARLSDTTDHLLAGEPLRAVNSPNESNKPDEYVVHAAPFIRGRVTDAILVVIIQNICEELEHVLLEETSQLPSISLQKYLEDRDIQAVSHACKSWRSRATASMCLWWDTAFDVVEPKSIRLVVSSLSLVEDQDVLLCIYAGFGHNNLPYPDVARLFSDLRRNTNRWAVLEYQGALGEYHSHLDLPAPNLRYFSDHRGSSQNIRKLFAGCTPSLRYSFPSNTRGWDSTNLSNPTGFRFGKSSCGPSPSLSSLLDLFQSAPGLETLRLE